MQGRNRRVLCRADPSVVQSSMSPRPAVSTAPHHLHHQVDQPRRRAALAHRCWACYASQRLIQGGTAAPWASLRRAGASPVPPHRPGGGKCTEHAERSANRGLHSWRPIPEYRVGGDTWRSFRRSECTQGTQEEDWRRHVRANERGGVFVLGEVGRNAEGLFVRPRLGIGEVATCFFCSVIGVTYVSGAIYDGMGLWDQCKIMWKGGGQISIEHERKADVNAHKQLVPPHIPHSVPLRLRAHAQNIASRFAARGLAPSGRSGPDARSSSTRHGAKLSSRYVCIAYRSATVHPRKKRERERTGYTVEIWWEYYSRLRAPCPVPSSIALFPSDLCSPHGERTLNGAAVSTGRRI